jgi:hypothetical protein
MLAKNWLVNQVLALEASFAVGTAFAVGTTFAVGTAYAVGTGAAFAVEAAFAVGPSYSVDTTFAVGTTYVTRCVSFVVSGRFICILIVVYPGEGSPWRHIVRSEKIIHSLFSIISFVCIYSLYFFAFRISSP